MIRAIVQGLGVIGGRAVRLIGERPDMECVGAVDNDPAKVGKDLGQVLELETKQEIIISSSLDNIIKRVKADIVVDASVSFIKDIQEQVFAVIKAGVNFVTTCEELAYPAAQYPAVAHEIDQQAKRHSVTVLGTGVNPGFSSDFLPLVFLGACEKVTMVSASRASNTHSYGSGVLDHFGIGKTLEYFDKAAADGSLPGHIGHPEQITEIADSLGWKLSEIKKGMKPMVSKSYRRGQHFEVEPGQVCGVEQVAIGMKERQEAISLKFVLLFQPTGEATQEDGIESGDYVSIEGIPNIEVAVKGLGDSPMVTSNRLVNAIPYVIQARPGLLSMKDFQPFVPLG